MSENSKLYGAFADRYDLHTPPRHYHHDHEFVMARAQALGKDARLLDVGCGTGVFLEKAVAAGLDGHGLDPAPAMLAEAAKRIGPERLQLATMQELSADQDFDVITALSWSFNYCRDLEEAKQVLARFHGALRPGGLIVLQIAHAPNAPSERPEFMVDLEPGPGGPEDVVMRYRFWSPEATTLCAEYRFECRSTSEAFGECHELHAADAFAVAECAREVGFEAVELLANYRGVSLVDERSLSPWLVARRG